MNVFFSNMSSLKVSANKISFLRSGSWELYHGVKSPLHVVSFRNFTSFEEIENTNFVSNVYPRTLRLKFWKQFLMKRYFDTKTWNIWDFSVKWILLQVLFFNFNTCFWNLKFFDQTCHFVFLLQIRFLVLYILKNFLYFSLSFLEK